jgi:putative SOS response-associated peptidase YedK
MCGRYSVGKTATELAEELDASLATDAIKPRFNVAPTQEAPMLVALPDRRLGLARFGWSLRNKKGLLLNARSETATSNGLFRTALERRRSLIPADGFYEWRVLGEGKKAPRQAYFLHDHGKIITFAGLYYVEKTLEKKEGEPQQDEPSPVVKQASFVILTTAASEAIQRVHDRMPIVVPPDMRSAWLDLSKPVEPLLRELAARDPQLELREVGSRVGSPANDDPSLRDPT